MNLKVVDLIKKAQKYGVNDSLGNSAAAIPPKVIKENRPLVFSNSEDSSFVSDFSEQDIKGLPFEICSVELEGKAAIKIPDIGQGDLWLHSVICHELSPGLFRFYALMSIDGINPDAVILVENGKLYGAVIAVVNNQIDRLSEGKLGHCEYKKSLMIRNKKSSSIVNISDYIYIDVSRSLPGKNSNGHNIIYLNSFEVRGHWRKIKGMGCDRAGGRNVQGATWIATYTKGDEELPLKKQIRVIN